MRVQKTVKFFRKHVELLLGGAVRYSNVDEARRHASNGFARCQ